MKQYNARHTAVLSTRGFYTILTMCALIVAASAWVLWTSVRRPAESETAADAPIITPVSTMPDLSADEPVIAEEPEPPEPEPADTPVPVPEQAKTVSAPVYVRPTAGAVITPFSGDELLFHPTMGDWRVHTGTDFAADAGEPVLALTDGTVTDVFDGGLYGSCVTLSHAADLTTTYCGLDEIRVVNGQTVTAGEALGACAEHIAAEDALGTHIHVEAARAGTAIDVLELLGEDEPE